MILYPSGTILATKVNENNDFVEEPLTSDDFNAVTITGNQLISGQKTFDQLIIASGLQNINAQDLQIGTSGTQNIDFFTNGITKLSLLNNGELNLKSHSGYSGSDLRVITTAIQTTTDGLTPLTSFTLDEGSAYWFEVFTIGRSSGGTLRIRMEINRACAYREVGGAATLIGNIDTTLARSLNAAGYDVDVDVNGNDIRVLVDGATGETVNWTTAIFYQKVATNI